MFGSSMREGGAPKFPPGTNVGGGIVAKSGAGSCCGSRALGTNRKGSRSDGGRAVRFAEAPKATDGGRSVRDVEEEPASLRPSGGGGGRAVRFGESPVSACQGGGCFSRTPEEFSCGRAVGSTEATTSDRAGGGRAVRIAEAS